MASDAPVPVAVYALGSLLGTLAAFAPAAVPDLGPAWSGSQLSLVAAAGAGIGAHVLGHALLPHESAGRGRAVLALVLPALVVGAFAVAVRLVAPELFALAWAAFVANVPATAADLWEAVAILRAAPAQRRSIGGPSLSRSTTRGM